MPVLLSRPDLPDYLADVFVCYTDLVFDGAIEWVSFIRWAEEYDLQDREYVWEVIGNAKQAVDKWQSSRAPQQSPGPRPTSQVTNR